MRTHPETVYRGSACEIDSDAGFEFKVRGPRSNRTLRPGLANVLHVMVRSPSRRTDCEGTCTGMFTSQLQYQSIGLMSHFDFTTVNVFEFH